MLVLKIQKYKIIVSFSFQYIYQSIHNDDLILKYIYHNQDNVLPLLYLVSSIFHKKLLHSILSPLNLIYLLGQVLYRDLLEKLENIQIINKIIKS